MGFVILIGLLLLSGWILFVTSSRLFTRHAGIAWWLVFGSLIILGMAIGCRLSYEFEYNVSQDLRVLGFPIPLCAFQLEDGMWVDFPSPDWFAYPAAFTNVVVVTAFAVLPALLASMFGHRKASGTREFSENP